MRLGLGFVDQDSYAKHKAEIVGAYGLTSGGFGANSAYGSPIADAAADPV